MTLPEAITKALSSLAALCGSCGNYQGATDRCYECSCYSYDPEAEKRGALEAENAPMSEHMFQWAKAYGAERPDQAWVGMPDGATWERNLHYTGPAVPHPESYEASF